MNSIRLRSLAVAMLLLGLLLALAPASLATPPAQDADTGLSVSNAKLELTLAPGKSYVHSMVVALGAKAQPLDLTVEARGFGMSLQGSFLALPADQDRSPQSARRFITKIDQPSFRLEPGRAHPVNVTIELPADAGTDPRYAIIYIASQPVSTGNAVANILAASVPVVITPTGAQVRNTGSITDLKVNATGAGAPIEVLTTVRNTGNLHFKVRSEATIIDPRGQPVATVRSPLSGTSIIPTFAQQLRAAYAVLDRPQGLPAGAYTVDVKVSREDGTLLDSRRGSFAIDRPYRPLPDIDESDLVIVSYRDQEPGVVDAKAKAGVEIAFTGTGKVTGQVAVGKYRQAPAAPPPLASARAEGGMGTAGLTFVGAQVDGFRQGTAQVRVRYSDANLAGANPNSLFLAYRANDHWTKLDNLAVFSGASIVQGELPVHLLAQGAVIALAGESPAGTGQAGGMLGLTWPVAVGIVAGGVVVGLFIGLLALRGRRQGA